jgi:hypothetical protein
VNVETSTSNTLSFLRGLFEKNEDILSPASCKNFRHVASMSTERPSAIMSVPYSFECNGIRGEESHRNERRYLIV